MVKQFLKFERKLKITPDEASILLGLSYDKYSRLKSGELEGRKLFDYSIEAHSLIDPDKISEIMGDRKHSLNFKPVNVLKPYKVFIRLEYKVNLGPIKTAELIGLDYPRYNEFKNGTVPLQIYHLYSIHAHKILNHHIVNKFKKERE